MHTIRNEKRKKATNRVEVKYNSIKSKLKM